MKSVKPATKSAACSPLGSHHPFLQIGDGGRDAFRLDIAVMERNAAGRRRASLSMRHLLTLPRKNNRQVRYSER
jgi:hypothetical protein